MSEQPQLLSLSLPSSLVLAQPPDFKIFDENEPAAGQSRRDYARIPHTDQAADASSTTETYSIVP